MATHHRPNV
jgi:hypothetical protein